MSLAASAFAQTGSTPAAANPDATPRSSGSSRGSVSVGRLNSVLGLGTMTAYGFRRDNRTLMVGGAVATALAYKKWSRSRTRLRSQGENETTAYGDLNPTQDEEYEFRKGRGETAMALALLPAYGIVKGKRTLVIAGGAATALAYRRYRQTKREGRAFRNAQRLKKKETNTAASAGIGNIALRPHNDWRDDFPGHETHETTEQTAPSKNFHLQMH